MEQTSRLAIVQLSPFQKRDVPRRLVFVVDLPRARNARNCPRAYREFPRGALIAFGVCEFRTKLITFRPERWCDWRHLVHFHATTKQQKCDPPNINFTFWSGESVVIGFEPASPAKSWRFWLSDWSIDARDSNGQKRWFTYFCIHTIRTQISARDYDLWQPIVQCFGWE